MNVKQLIGVLKQCDPYALVLVATFDENGDIQMVEATATKDIRSGDVEIVPAE